jgi:hypothetical protein
MKYTLFITGPLQFSIIETGKTFSGYSEEWKTVGMSDNLIELEFFVKVYMMLCRFDKMEITELFKVWTDKPALSIFSPGDF